MSKDGRHRRGHSPGTTSSLDGEASITLEEVQILEQIFDLSPSKPLEEINKSTGWIKIEWSSVPGPSSNGFSNVKIKIQSAAIITQKNLSPLVSFILQNMTVS